MRALVLVLVTGCAATSPPEWDALRLADVEQGTRVRAVTASRVAVGTLDSCSEAELRVNGTALPLADIDTLEVKADDTRLAYAGWGALIGGGVGVASGLATGLMVICHPCDQVEVAALSAVVTGIVSALVGAGIGYLVGDEVWRPVTLP